MADIALDLGVLRRHMTVTNWAAAFEQLLEIRGVKRMPGPKGDAATVAAIAKELGVPERTARCRLEWAGILDSEPKLREQVRKGELSAKQAIGIVKKKQRKRNKEQERNRVARRGKGDDATPAANLDSYQ